MKSALTTLALTAVCTLSGLTAPAAELPLDKIKLPDGFSISVYGDNVFGARSMALGTQGTLFVGSQQSGRIRALVDTDGDNKADKIYVIAEKLWWPNGVAFRDGSLYVAEINRIIRYDDIENKLDAPPEPVVLVDDLPEKQLHGWKYLNFGPDGKLYFGIGAPCNDCDPMEEFGDERFATIMRMNADGSELEPYAHGVRNSVGFTWHPENGDLYFSDTGRDLMGDDIPDCELNRATEAGQHFGFPYFHGGDVPDPTHGKGKNPDDYVKPIQKMGPHVTPLGLTFYTGSQFPAEYKNRLFIAQHGSWNRSIKIGYRVMQVTLDETGNAASYKEFATGWLARGVPWGRPVDVLVAPDGALLVSDDKANVIYRIAYTG
ncbi:MAG: PQQ-dependent sugar dehydrogenase [Candidatus Hydrogenedentes bacterium]|nr:PQQ-dependent sugar dehydrogenase [Candidatus Hydrogenedentota bacterium]